ncbi:MAG: hypothetical protein H0X69_00335 [Gemmatimonadales bacterium]|nr:hypothetical protein [Gemmatimonadales bacterium]
MSGSDAALERIAQAVLYEGYLLWPYRRSALKNRQRWTFGGVYPQAWSDARGGDDAWRIVTECLLEAADPAAARLRVRVRFLQVVDRRVACDADGNRRYVDELVAGGRRHLAWEEAVERQVILDDLAPAALETPRLVPLDIAAGTAEEPVLEEGRPVGAVVRSWDGIQGAVTLRAVAVQPGLWRLRIEIANTTPWSGGSREAAQRRALISTHATVQANGGAFVSLTDPPAELAAAAAACRNIGAWPVLVGELGERHTLLSAPIILGDYPRIAPESPGDLFDGGEIDQLLILNILALTDEERAEMRDSDPRAREILDRCMALGPEELSRLHGAVRELRVVGAE